MLRHDGSGGLAHSSGLARHVVAKLARKRLSPLRSGRAATWSGGTVWALGQVNFLFDRSSEPYVAHDDLAEAFGLSKSTLGQKAKQIRDMLKMTWGAYLQGVIPYIPDLGRDGTAAAMAAQRS